MKHTYRISSWRFDVRKSTHSTPSFEGKTVEECDDQAMKHFETVSAQPANEWNGMDLVRIDTPAVAEKTTLLTKNGRQENND